MSNPCTNCHADNASNMTHCPLCGKHLDAADRSATVSTAYVSVDKRKLRQKMLIPNMRRFMWIGVLVCIVINLFYAWGNWNLSSWWCLYVAASALLVNITVFYPVGHRMFYWKEVFWGALTILAYLVFIDFMQDSRVSYSMTWVFPIVIGAMSVVMAFFLAIRKSDPGNVLLVSLILFLFCLATFLVGFFVFTRVIEGYTVLPSFIAMLTSFFVFVFFSTFKYKAFVKTLFKRFHV